MDSGHLRKLIDKHFQLCRIQNLVFLTFCAWTQQTQYSHWQTQRVNYQQSFCHGDGKETELRFFDDDLYSFYFWLPLKEDSEWERRASLCFYAELWWLRIIFFFFKKRSEMTGPNSLISWFLSQLLSPFFFFLFKF